MPEYVTHYLVVYLRDRLSLRDGRSGGIVGADLDDGRGVGDGYGDILVDREDSVYLTVGVDVNRVNDNDCGDIATTRSSAAISSTLRNIVDCSAKDGEAAQERDGEDASVSHLARLGSGYPNRINGNINEPQRDRRSVSWDRMREGIRSEN